MLNWYRAMLRHRSKLPSNVRVHAPALILWEMQDVALSHRMARLSLEYRDYDCPCVSTGLIAGSQMKTVVPTFNWEVIFN